jgi:carotenoid cleavage dioxygenase-like enzyme
VPRVGEGDIMWIESETFWVWHLANAYEDGGTIVVDFPAFNTLGFLDPHTPVSGAYTRAVLDPAAGTLERTVLHDGISEFPRVDDRRVGRRHRYVTVGAASGSARTAGEHDVLCRVDLETGAWDSFDTGAVIGEVVFAPRPGGTDELDGWYLTFGTSLDDGHSWLYVWDAETFPGPPRARVHIPQRVPNGLHGNWFAAG